MITYVLAAAAFLTLLASLVYIRSARLRFRVVRLIDADVNRDVEAHSLAFSAYRKEAHSAIVYGLLATVLGSAAVIDNPDVIVGFAALAAPAIASLLVGAPVGPRGPYGRNRWDIERRAGEALEQEQLAPGAWAADLAPKRCRTSPVSRSGGCTRLARV